MQRYCPHCSQPFKFAPEMLACPHCGGALILNAAPPPPPAALPPAEAPPPPAAPVPVSPSLPPVPSKRAAAPVSRGLAFFDGDGWRTHATETAGVPLDRVYELVTFHDQLYARAVTGEVAAYAGGRWTVVDVPPAGNTPREVVVAMAADENAVWFGGHSGFSRYDESGWSVINHESTDLDVGGVCNDSMGVDARGMLWFLRRKSLFTVRGLASFTGQSIRVRGKDEGFPHTTVGSPLIPDRHDRIWFGATRGVCYWAQSRFQCIGDDVCRPLGDLVTGMALDPEGRMWVCTGGSGLVARLPDQHTVYGQADGLPTDDLTAIAFDAAGDLWLGTTDGVFRFRDAKLTDGEHYTAAEGLPGSFIHLLHAGPRGVWAACGGSLVSFDMRLTRAIGRVIVGGSRLVHPVPYP